MNKYYVSKNYNPYHNLGIEKFLIENNEENFALFLWQNKKTVVIGKNQNAYEECNLDVMRNESIKLARRLTGGGAVYHHLGNLNFSFIMPKHLFDINRQLNVILKALTNLNINAEFSGRNDLLCEGRKFSGNAFLISNTSLHHGTILIRENIDIIEEALKVKPAKLLSKGVKSIKSRMINLAEINPKLTTKIVLRELISSFINEYGPSQELSLEENSYHEHIKFFSSKNWIFGKSATYNLHREGRCKYGQLDFYLQLDDNIIKSIKVYTDSLDENLATELENALVGIKFTSANTLAAISKTYLSPSEIIPLLF